MSELKDYDIMDIEAMDDERLEKSESGKIQVTRVYIKSEADKVIANRDYEIKSLKDSIGKLLRANTEQIIHEVVQKTLIYGEGFIRVQDAMKLIAELRHNKYKRCLAMARWCESKVYHIRRTHLCDMDEHEGWQHDDEFWQRWHKRWLELAEQFKETK